MSTTDTSSNFYVYEHWRPDTNTVFYVGKGRGGRAYVLGGRRRYHKAIVAKLSRNGMAPEVRIVIDGLTEPEAFALEIARIAMYRAAGVQLCNLTDGGDGASGYKFTDEQVAKNSANKKVSMANPETKEKHRASVKAAWAIPEVKEKCRAIMKATMARSDVQEKRRCRIYVRKAGREGPIGVYLQRNGYIVKLNNKYIGWFKTFEAAVAAQQQVKPEFTRPIDTTHVVGVYKRRDRCYVVKFRRKRVGAFKTFEEAVAARKQAEQGVWGAAHGLPETLERATS